MTADSSAPPPRRFLNGLFAAATLLSAWLLFQVQPMVAKRLLPWFGGGTAIWTTALLFFQTGLLAGYLYAHVIVSRLPLRRQAAVHSALLLAAVGLVIAIPVVPAASWEPDSSERPALRILLTLAACVGLPYFALSATAPLVQAWFARVNPGKTPYRLYALSNIGALAALVSYPFLIEPMMGVARQGMAWTALFAVFAALCAASGWLSARASAAAPGDDATTVDAQVAVQSTASGRPRALAQFFWLGLPMCASVALVAITAHLCLDVASLPLLWIAPMVTYLLSFILTFESDRWYGRWFWLAVLAASSFVVVWMWHNAESATLLPQIIAHLILLFSIGMVCHGELARMRPPSERLTSFYLSISAGGALGGVFTGIVAPLLFADTYELPLGILAAWALALAVLVTDRQSKFYDGGAFRPLLGMVGLFVVLAIAMGVLEAKKRTYLVAGARNFYAALKVREIAADRPELAYYKLTNGRISHGAQYRAASNSRFPSQYFYPNSGIGLVLGAPHTEPRRVGVVGLGVGTLAAYADAGDSYTFYEINPQVIEFAEKYFTYLSDARDRFAKITIVPGDARLMLERQEAQDFDVLALDAFTSDAIPSHLLTLEAMDEYLRHLREPDGVLAVHISHRHLRLSLVLRAAAERLKLAGRIVNAPPDGTPAGQASTWVLLYRPDAAIAERQLGTPLEADSPDRSAVVWTDDYNSILDVLGRSNE